MKILCVIDNLGSGGAQRQLVELAIGFKSYGHDVFFLTYHDTPFYNPILENHKIPINYILEQNYLLRLLRMRLYIRKGKYDAVLSFLEAANFICEVASIPYRKWKLVVGERSANPEISRVFKLKMFRWFHILADFVVANSYSNNEIVQSVIHILPKSRFEVIYNIVDFNRWKPLNNYIPRRNGNLKIVVVASHQYLKNLDGLIEALSLLSSDEHSKVRIDWYGDRLKSPFFDNSIVEAKSKIVDLKLDNIITFYPATLDLTLKIQEADVVGLFSFYEGLPNTICEGMACGKPIICSAVSDIPILLSHEPNLLCSPYDPISIKNALTFLIGLKSERLTEIGQKNLKIARMMFDKEMITANYLKLLNK